MKRILMVLVLLIGVSLMAPAGQYGSALADDGSVVQAPRRPTNPTGPVGNFYGPAGDPDGMGTGNGVVEPPAELLPVGTTAAGAVPEHDPAAEAYLRIVLTLAKLLVI